MKRSLTLNGVKATIYFHDTKGFNEPTTEWELTLESNNSIASISDFITLDVCDEDEVDKDEVKDEFDDKGDDEGDEGDDEGDEEDDEGDEGEDEGDEGDEGDDEGDEGDLEQEVDLEQQKRIELMKKIFEKNDLVFKMDFMKIYEEWEKPYGNRYVKMCAFVDMLKVVFY